MEYNGKTIADSQFCIEYLKSQLGVDVNSHLTKDLIVSEVALNAIKHIKQNQDRNSLKIPINNIRIHQYRFSSVNL
jgi:hypothetical protein